MVKTLLSQTTYTIISIGLIIFLLVIFFITYVKNKKTPIPKECQDLINDENCQSCKNVTCSNYKKSKGD